MAKIQSQLQCDCDDTGWLPRERVLVLILAAATLIALFLSYLIVRPFLPILAWALALAIIARPLHDALMARIHNENIAAGAAVFVVALLIVVPACFVFRSLVEEAAAGAERMKAEAQNGGMLAAAEATPGVGPAVRWLQDNVDVSAALHETAMFLTRHAPGAVVFSIWLILQLLLVLFTLFFFLRDRGRVLRAVRSSLPLSSAETDDVFRKVTDTVHAIVYGSLAVAVIQGTMGGLMFWWLGLPSPVLWGVIMALLAVVPNLGTFIVWAPTAVYLALSGDWGEALILAAWGGIAIAFIDNLLYPYLVGHRLRLHTLLVFIAMLGGLWLLGASGVVIGPVILVITLALVDVWRHRTSGGKSAEADVKAA